MTSVAVAHGVHSIIVSGCVIFRAELHGRRQLTKDAKERLLLLIETQSGSKLLRKRTSTKHK